MPCVMGLSVVYTWVTVFILTSKRVRSIVQYSIVEGLRKQEIFLNCG